MSFEWLAKTPNKHGMPHVHTVTTEFADRAGTLFRLGFTEQQATDRLAAWIAWEYDAPTQHGPHRRPEALSDAVIAKIVADTYARRPG
ncbi:hypothetical protein BH11MYX1_BH11MYX1_51880 [soil metagenome]